MAHVTLYRKWRPQSFEEVIGQEFVVKTIANAIAANSLAHAYLFTGPRGTGKTSMARILAKAVNCAAGPTPHPDNTCDSCRAITEGTSLDVIEIDAASNRGIDDIRELRDKVAFSPAESRKKVYIIDEVHMLTTEAFNALLKTLEEPPDHVIFVLATTEPQKVPKTILSRCQRFDFRRVDAGELRVLLEKIAEAEGLQVEPGCLSLVARYAHGSVRDALVSLDQLASYAGDTIKLADCTSLLQMVETELLLRLGDVVGEADVTGAFRLVQELVESGKDLQQFVRDAVDHFRLLFLLQNLEDGREFADVEEETYQLLQQQARSLDPRRTLRFVDLLNAAGNEMKGADAPRILLEMTLARMCRPELDSGPGSLDARVERLEDIIQGLQQGGGMPPAAPPAGAKKPAEKLAVKKPETAPAEPALPAGTPAQTAAGAGEPPAAEAPEESPETTAVPPQAQAHIDIETVKRGWTQVMERVKKKKRTTHALLQEGIPSALNGPNLLLKFHPRTAFHASEILKPAHATIITGALQETFGIKMGIDTIVDHDEPEGGTHAPAEEMVAHEAAAQVHEEPDAPPPEPEPEQAHEPRQEIKKTSNKSGTRRGIEWSNGVHEHSQIKMARDIFGDTEIVEVISLTEEGLD